MRITDVFLGVYLGVGGLLAADAAYGFDGETDGPMQLTPSEAFHAGAQAYYAGDKDSALSSLLSAAEQGHAMAQWKLARMYAEGDGVKKSDIEAFNYYSRLADAHADDHPSTPQARFVASAFVALGSYYMDGIPETDLKPNKRRAVDLFTHAATYFGDPEAQYQLARLYLDGDGVRKDAVQAARWLQLAARKNHSAAQATLGEMLFRGQDVPRKPVQGLMWLELARQGALTHQDEWIFYLHEHAFAEAGQSERERAIELADQNIGR